MVAGCLSGLLHGSLGRVPHSIARTPKVTRRYLGGHYRLSASQLRIHHHNCGLQATQLSLPLTLSRLNPHVS